MPFEQIGPVKLDAVVNVRLTPGEKADLVRQATDAGLSLSELVRRRALGRCVDAATDRSMIRELNRIGGLLKQIYKNGGDPLETGPTYLAARKAIDRLAR